MGEDEREDSPFASPTESGVAIDTSNVRPFGSGLNGSWKLTNLDDEEISALCSKARTYFFSNASGAQLERAICVEEDGVGATSVAECALFVDDCLSTTLFEYLECNLNGLLREGAECTATVDMYEACETEWASAAKAYVEYFTCDLADPTLDKDLPQQLRSGFVKCRALYEACPALGS